MSHDLPVPEPERRERRRPPGRARLAVGALCVAVLATVGACAQDETGDAVEPSDQRPLPPQQPGGGDDPTLSGDDTSGVGGGQSGGTGSGAPDSGDMQGGAGEDSPTGGDG